MARDNIIQFPGCGPAESKEPLTAVPPPETEDKPSGPGMIIELKGVPPPEVEKALNIILSGMSFVVVGVKETAQGSGADFFSSAHGDKAVLARARDHMAEMQSRAMTRYGVE